MTTDEQMEALCRKILPRINTVNEEYLKLVGQQIAKIGKLNPSSILRLTQLRICGENTARIKRELAKILKIAVPEVEKLLNQAVQEEYTSAEFQALAMDIPLTPLADNTQLQRYVEAVSRQTVGQMLNFSNTTSVSDAYREVVSDAIDAVFRGVTDYNSAIRSSMRKLGGDGLQVTYESGYRRRMDSAIRQNILDGVRQVRQQANRMLGEEIGADGVELSAHPFSALDHEPVQGRQFDLDNFQKMQSGGNFHDTDGNYYLGFKRPIGQWNCHHLVSYIILGVSGRSYSNEQLKKWKEANHAGCEIDGKHYTVYQASQLMRKLETEVRRQKDIANLAKVSGDDVLRREAQAKIRDLKAKYSEVAVAARLTERRRKMEVKSYRETPEETALANKTGSTIAQARADIKAGKYPLTINQEKQARHLPGSARPGGSVVTLSVEELQKIVNQKAGLGTIRVNSRLEWDKKEILRANTIIGYTSNKDGAIIFTNKMKVHYSKTGIHVVPYSGR